MSYHCFIILALPDKARQVTKTYIITEAEYLEVMFIIGLQGNPSLFSLSDYGSI